MRIPIVCFECSADFSVPPLWWKVAISNDGVHRAKCPVGHDVVVVLQNETWEMLFDAGCIALVSQTLREAVADFASCLERFLAFYVRIILRQREIDGKPVSGAALDAIAKVLRNSSERELGAFWAAYLFQTGESPLLVKDQEEAAAFRNRVVHKGEFPTEPEARSYGAHVYALISRVLAELRASNAQALAAETNATLLAKCEGLSTRAAITHAPTILTVVPRDPRGTFDEELEKFVRTGAWLRMAGDRPTGPRRGPRCPECDGDATRLVPKVGGAEVVTALFDAGDGFVRLETCMYYCAKCKKAFALLGDFDPAQATGWDPAKPDK